MPRRLTSLREQALTPAIAIAILGGLFVLAYRDVCVACPDRGAASTDAGEWRVTDAPDRSPVGDFEGRERSAADRGAHQAGAVEALAAGGAPEDSADVGSDLEARDE